MNREIKFRVWHKKSKEWCGIIYLNETISPHSLEYEEEDLVFCQFTGFKDKNGQEIYEGDLLTVENEIFLIVEWNKDLGQFQQRNPQSGEQYDLSVYEYVVVGNIFSYPCNPDHNGECLVCDCWLSECPFKK
jgi:hypothetical protein